MTTLVHGALNKHSAVSCILFWDTCVSVRAWLH